MNVYLLRSSELDNETYTDVINLLQGFPGFINFQESEVELQFPLENRTASWPELFNQCRLFRQEKDIGDAEAVFLLTSVSNDRNWFSGAEQDRFNFFVHTEDWEYFLGNSVDRRYPIVYEIVANILQYFMFDDYQQLFQHIHEEPRGCLMDFCKTKREVILKLRTGDVCDDCLQLIKKRKIDHRIIKQCFDIIDGVRDAMMFRNRSEILNQPSRMEIRGHMKEIFLSDLGDLEIRLNPKERSLYLLFLNHPEGINLHDLTEHRDELLDYYQRFGGGDDRQTINESIYRLVDPLDNNIHEVISKIRRKFTNAVGNNLTDHYIISGERGQAKFIAIDRELVIYN